MLIYYHTRPHALPEPHQDVDTFICVLILLYMCPHTAIYVSSHCYICDPLLLYLCPHTAKYVSASC
jgi:hypothetical protein